MEAVLVERNFQLGQQATFPHSGSGSENDEPVGMTRQATGLPPDTLKEMGVLLYPRWQDWSKVFDGDDHSWKEVWRLTRSISGPS